MPVTVVLIPITGIIFGVGLVMLVIYLDHLRRSDALRHAHEERMAALEKGIELPPPLPVTSPSLPALPGMPPDGPERAFWLGITLGRHRANGLTLLLAGAAIMVAMWETGNEYFWWGLVPVAIGLSALISASLGLQALKGATRRGSANTPQSAVRQNGQRPED
jgi:hypothetical protein